MKAKLKKSMLGLATLGMVVAPIATTISCGKTDSIVILSGKQQIEKSGKQFAKTFDGMSEGKLEGAPSQTKFITAGGKTFNATLATSVGSAQFPSAMTIAVASEAKPYVKKDYLLKFKNPKYDKSSKQATDKNAESYNKKMAGDKINELIKAIQLSGNPKFMMSGDKIIGVPTYSESIGVIYNKNVFKKYGINTIKYQPKPTNGSKSIFSGNPVAINVDSNHDTLYANDLTSENFKKLKLWFKIKGVESIGASVNGDEAWAFTAKIGNAATIGWASKLANLNSGNVHIPGDSISANDLTPDSAQSKLFGAEALIDKNGNISGTNKKGFEVYKDALELYIKDAKIYDTKLGMADGLAAGQFAMMPGGSWMETYLSKGGFKDFGMLPLSMLTDNTNKPFISKGISGYWQFSNQKKANNREGAKAIAAQTKAVNFVWAQYLSQKGKDILRKDMGLLNPYDSSASARPNSADHPLLSTSEAIQHVSPWGAFANKTGNGKNGFERNNTTYSSLLADYHQNSNGTTLSKLLNHIKTIWRMKK